MFPAMTKFPGHPRIESDPQIMVGKPVIAGTRIPVETIVRQLAAGATWEWVLSGYPGLSTDDVKAALAFAADRVSEPAE
jgi:uncharacterized protein (DUF433 family)